MPIPILPIVGVVGLAAIILNAQNKKAKAVPPPPPPAPRAAPPAPAPRVAPNVVVPTTFAPSPPPPPTVPIVPGTRIGDVIIGNPVPPVTIEDGPRPGAQILSSTTVTGTPRTEAQSAANETSKRKTVAYYKWAQAGLNKTVPVSSRTVNTAPLDVDGKWGPKSTQRAKDFQNMINKEFASVGNANRLAVDGIVGENTELQLVIKGAGDPPWMTGGSA